MGPTDYSADANSADPAPRPTEAALQNLSQALEDLRQGLVTQLNQEIEALQRHKQALMRDVEQLEQDLSQLQASYGKPLSQQQQAQHEAWARHLAQALATHLQRHLEVQPPSPEARVTGRETLGGVSQGLADLDGALHRSLQTLQQDLSSYQSSISQQVSRMHTLQQQGEVILEALVGRLSQELQNQLVRPQPPALQAQYPLPRPPRAQPALAGPSPPGQAGPGTWVPAWLPLGLSLIAMLALSSHNLLVGLVASGGQWLGRVPLPAIFPLSVINAVMLLWLRMVVVVPLLALLAIGLQPTLRADLTALFRPTSSPTLIRVLTSGVFLGLSQVLLYRAIADLGPGLAVTLLFTYPLLAIPLSWFSQGERPNPLRLVALFALTMGLVFTALPDLLGVTGRDTTAWGLATALLAAAAFGLHWLTLQLTLQQLPLVPTTLMQFSTVFGLSSLILMVAFLAGLGPTLPSNPAWLYGAGLALGLLTLVGYLANHYGQRFSDQRSLPVLAAAIPLVTAGLAYGLLPGGQSVLQFIQWVGVILVSLGGVSLALDRRHPRRAG
ncbi:MAG: EamA family transporter [Cyanobacteriota bacterium]|nr:EamA family transporter [Cyanobacteriota bacterium]